MNILYYKRFRMEIDLRTLPATPRLPDGYFFVPWDEGLLHHHAEVHYHAFCEELDATLFPSFGDRYGCQFLMQEIRKKPGFVPEATWLLACAETCCGAIQGTHDKSGLGAIQNVGVTPEHRGLGLGTALIIQAMHGFRMRGLHRAYLEVTADNRSAIRLYQRLGFRRIKTVYKAVDE